MRCAYHPDQDAVWDCATCRKLLCEECEVTCNKCGVILCQECVEVVNGKNLCRNCALPIKQKEGLNWFQRHLNWTLLLAAIPIYLIVTAYVAVAGLAMQVGTASSITGLLLIPLGLWILRQKHLRWWNVFIVSIPYFIGWIVFLKLENRRPLYEPVRDTTNHSTVEAESTEGLSVQGISVHQQNDSSQSHIDEQRKDKDTKNFCPSCGHKVTRKMAYCSNCGNKIRE